MSEVLEAQSRFSKFWSKKINKVLVILGGVLLVGLVAVLGYFYYVKNYAPVVVINGQKIYKKDLVASEKKFSKFFEVAKADNLDSLQRAKDLLLEEVVVETEAQKNGLSVTEEEIQTQVDAQVKVYGSKDAYERMLKDSYGWTEADTRYRIKIDILRNKLKKVVLNQRTGTLMFFRSDLYTPEDPNQKLAAAELDKVRLRVVAGEKPEDIKAEYQASIMWQAPVSGTYDFVGVNEGNSDAMFMGHKEDWLAIRELNKPGDISPTYTSSGGYYAFAILNSIGGGSYDTWEDFLQSRYQTNAFDLTVSYLKGLPSKTSHIAALFLEVGKSVVAPQVAYAACNGNSGGWWDYLLQGNDGVHCLYANFDTIRDHHLTQYSGWVIDNVARTGIPGATVTANYSSNNWSLYWSSYAKWGTSFSTTSDSTARYTGLGNVDGAKINCWLYWNLAASHPNYYTATVNTNPANGPQNYWDAYLNPIPYSLSIGIYTDTNGDGAFEGNSSGGTVTAQNIDCPNISCYTTYTYSGGLTKAVTANVNTGSGVTYDFVGWNFVGSGSGLYTGPAAAGFARNAATGMYEPTGTDYSWTIGFGENWTAHAYFRRISPSCPTSFTASSASINLGDLVTLSWSAPGNNTTGVIIDPLGTSQGTTATTLVHNPANTTTYHLDITGTRGTTQVCPGPTVVVKSINSCKATPGVGQNPLVTKVSVISSGLTNQNGFFYTFGDGTTLEGGPTAYHTYNARNTYLVSVSHPEYRSGLAVTCEPTSGVLVNDPSTNTGGEVRP